MPLGLIPKVLNPIDVVMSISKQFGMVDPKVLKFRYIQHVISAPAILIDDASRHHFTLYDRV